MAYFNFAELYLVNDEPTLARLKNEWLARDPGQVLIKPGLYTLNQFINQLLKARLNKPEISEYTERFWFVSWLKRHWPREGSFENLIDNISFIFQLADKIAEIVGVIKLAKLDLQLVANLPPGGWGEVLAQACRDYDAFLEAYGLTDKSRQRLTLLNSLESGVCPPEMALVKTVNIGPIAKISAYEVDFLRALTTVAALQVEFKAPGWILDENLPQGHLTGLDTLLSLKSLERIAETVNNLDLSFKTLARPDSRPGLAFMADNLFAPPDNIQPAPAYDDCLEIYSAPGYEAEVRETGRKVRELLRQGIKPERIIVAAPDLNLYRDYFKDLSDLPLYFQQGMPLASTGPARAVLAWLDLWGSTWPRLKVLDFFKCPYLHLSSLDFKDIYGLSWRAQATDERAGGGLMDFLPKIPGLKAKSFLKSLKILKNSYAALDKAPDWGVFFKKLKETWLGFKFKEQLINNSSPDKWLDLSAGRQVLAIFAEVEEIFKSSEAPLVNREIFQFVLKEKLRAADLQFKAQPGGGLKVLNYGRLLGEESDYLFLLGLGEKIFPKNQADYQPWPEKLSEELRKLLGHTRWPGPSEYYRRQEEQLAWALGQVKEKIIISYSRLDSNFRLALPSPVIGALQRLGPEYWPIKKVEVNSRPPEKIFLASEMWEKLAAEDIRALTVPDFFSQADQELFKLLKRKITLSETRKSNLIKAGLADNAPPLVDKEALLGWLSGLLKWRDNAVLSPSQMESYAQCPFLFWIKDLLKTPIEEEPGDETSSPSLGVLMHLVLNEFITRQVKKENWPLQGSAEELSDLLSLLDKQLAIFENKNPLGRWPVWLVRKKALKASFKDWLNRQAQSPSAPLYTPKLFEWAFKADKPGETNQGTFNFEPQTRLAGDPLLVTTEETLGQGLCLAGRVDRVDFSSTEAVVWDYKLTFRPDYFSRLKNEDICQNNFQLATYCLAVEQNFGCPVKGSYQFLAGPLEIKELFCPSTTDEILARSPETRKQLASDNKLNFLNALAGHWEHLKNGYFYPLENNNCDFCPAWPFCPLKEA